MTAYSAYTEPELAGLLKQGDKDAFTEIFTRYQSLLYIFAYKKTADREEAKDLIHDLFGMLWEKRESLSVAGNLAPYLFTLLKNKIFDLYKHKKVSQRYLDTFQDYLDVEPEAADYRVRHKDLAELIEKEIAALPEKMRIVFELSRNTDMSRKEIAERLGLPEETVKSRMHHSLKILKGKLGTKSFLIFF
ncbi:RNA polymerase sigma factor [Pedobacter africanus]|uniref:Sigma-70 region 2 n=1 Tax=Pedobacter africanus TaxID=151894 RepID=A0A1W1ZFJ7_9SPHI|nr:RNA polymerase sigma-70 factor [Pedobacter africanus]SMC47143.1 Sigma-70 region 2 [Pedobacter africanus]